MHIIANVPVECPKCRAEGPESSQFCFQCGHPLTEDAQALAQHKTPRWTAILLVLFLGLLAYVSVHLYNDWRSASRPIVATSPSPVPVQTAPPPQPQPQLQTHSIPVTNGGLSVNAGSYSWYVFKVPPGASEVAVTGNFLAAGGSANDIKVYILDEDGFASFKNAQATRTLYNSGKVSKAAINAALPGASATYYLVFDNRFSPESAKAVQVVATLSFRQ